MRLDKYLKVSRIIKRRTVANEACDSGRVMLNDKVARASAEVKAGDVIEIGDEGYRVADHVQAGGILVDGLGIGDVGNIVLRDRQNLA